MPTNRAREAAKRSALASPRSTGGSWTAAFAQRFKFGHHAAPDAAAVPAKPSKLGRGHQRVVSEPVRRSPGGSSIPKPALRRSDASLRSGNRTSRTYRLSAPLPPGLAQPIESVPPRAPVAPPRQTRKLVVQADADEWDRLRQRGVVLRGTGPIDDGSRYPAMPCRNTLQRRPSVASTAPSLYPPTVRDVPAALTPSVQLSLPPYGTPRRRPSADATSIRSGRSASIPVFLRAGSLGEHHEAELSAPILSSAWSNTSAGDDSAHSFDARSAPSRASTPGFRLVRESSESPSYRRRMRAASATSEDDSVDGGPRSSQLWSDLEDVLGVDLPPGSTSEESSFEDYVFGGPSVAVRSRLPVREPLAPRRASIGRRGVTVARRRSSVRLDPHVSVVSASLRSAASRCDADGRQALRRLSRNMSVLRPGQADMAASDDGWSDAGGESIGRSMPQTTRKLSDVSTASSYVPALDLALDADAYDEAGSYEPPDEDIERTPRLGDPQPQYRASSAAGTFGPRGGSSRTSVASIGGRSSVSSSSIARLAVPTMSTPPRGTKIPSLASTPPRSRIPSPSPTPTPSPTSRLPVATLRTLRPGRRGDSLRAIVRPS